MKRAADMQTASTGTQTTWRPRRGRFKKYAKRSSSRPWTPEEDEMLEHIWRDHFVKSAITSRIPWRSWTSICTRANRTLGLTMLPPGWLTVSRAAKKAGYDKTNFRNILARCKVTPMRYTRVRPVAKKPGARPSPRFIVEWIVVEKAIKKYLARMQSTETSMDAARRVLPRRATRKMVFSLAHRIREDAKKQGVWVRGGENRFAPAQWDEFIRAFKQRQKKNKGGVKPCGS